MHLVYRCSWCEREFGRDVENRHDIPRALCPACTMTAMPKGGAAYHVRRFERLEQAPNAAPTSTLRSKAACP